MISKNITIHAQTGVHAKPAAMFVKLANNFESSIKVKKDDLEINGKSIMGLLMLALTQNTEIIITANGVDEEKAIQELTSLINNNFEDKNIL